MGRYCYFSTGEEYKFWFACQSSEDITKFGGHEDDKIYWTWNKENDLPVVKRKLTIAKKEFETKFKQTYESFMEEINSGKHCEFPEKHEIDKIKRNELAAYISLGEVIKKGLETDDWLSVEAET